MKPRSSHVRCALSGQEVSAEHAIPVKEIRPSLREILRKDKPSVADEDFLSQAALNSLRLQRIQQMLVEDKGEVTDLEREVLESIENRRLIAPAEAEEKVSLGDRLADRVASFGGSWSFIILFFALMAVWIALNIGVILLKPFDPYPFILMNLILSCLAAIQAPIIMMSQNRQANKDRAQANHDYQVNLKSEIEIRALHEKLDRLVGHQWQQLLEIQQMQMDMLQEVRAKGAG